MSGGSAWTRDHDKILDHARGLHYDHVPGVTLPSADADKATWTTAMDAFNDWKAREVAKEASGQAWWQTYKDGGGGKGGGKGGDKTPKVKLPWDDPTNKTNVYHPMLVPEYNDPQAQDWSEYMPDGQSGLLYQPWSQEYGEQFMQPNIWNYQPPELTVGRPQYYQNPLGIMEVIDYIASSVSKELDPDDTRNVENRGGPDRPGADSDTGSPDVGVGDEFGPPGSEDGIL